jgi:hypothetical protein
VELVSIRPVLKEHPPTLRCKHGKHSASTKSVLAATPERVTERASLLAARPKSKAGKKTKKIINFDHGRPLLIDTASAAAVEWIGYLNAAVACIGVCPDNLARVGSIDKAFRRLSLAGCLVPAQASIRRSSSPSHSVCAFLSPATCVFARSVQVIPSDPSHSCHASSADFDRSLAFDIVMVLPSFSPSTSLVARANHEIGSLHILAPR